MNHKSLIFKTVYRRRNPAGTVNKRAAVIWIDRHNRRIAKQAAELG